MIEKSTQGKLDLNGQKANRENHRNQAELGEEYLSNWENHRNQAELGKEYLSNCMKDPSMCIDRGESHPEHLYCGLCTCEGGRGKPIETTGDRKITQHTLSQEDLTEMPILRNQAETGSKKGAPQDNNKQTRKHRDKER